MNENSRIMCEMCSKLAINTPERCQRSRVFIVNFGQISHIVPPLSLLKNEYLV